MASRRQTCVSRGTLEAEIVADDLALRSELLAALPLWEPLLGRKAQCLFMEDNQAECKVIKAGGSQKLMHLPRTHRIDAAAVSEQFSSRVVDLRCERTQHEAADVGAERFTDPVAWAEGFYLVNIVTPTFWGMYGVPKVSFYYAC